MIKCASGKRVYVSTALAEEALIEAHIHFDYRSGGGPISVYTCDDCGYHHLTSRGPVNERLAKAQADGTISKQKEAARWQGKFKGR